MLDADTGPGSGTSLPRWVLISATVSASCATGLSLWTIALQLKNYRKPLLREYLEKAMRIPQYSFNPSLIVFGILHAGFYPTLKERWVVRVLCMVPIYSIASLIALYSLDAAYLIDLVRDLYEAFCI